LSSSQGGAKRELRIKREVKKKKFGKVKLWKKNKFGKRRRALVTLPRVGGRLNEIWVPFTKKTGG
jgi:hypothetical protein